MNPHPADDVKDQGASTALKILIAEDNQHLRDLIKRSLVRLGHRIVGEANNGEETINLFRRENPDLIILDIDMPNINGIEAARTILGVREVPIIFSSGCWDSYTLKKVRQLGVSFFLTKPFSPAQLKVAIGLAVPGAI